MAPEVLTILTECRGKGMLVKDACAVAGVSTTYYKDHHRKGLDDLQAGRNDTPDATFASALEKAEADRLGQLLAGIRRAGEGGVKVTKTVVTEGGKDGTITTTEIKEQPPQWQALAWLAERTRQEFQLHKPEDGEEEGVVEGANQGSGLTRDEARAAARAILQVRREKREADRLAQAKDVTPPAEPKVH